MHVLISYVHEASTKELIFYSTLVFSWLCQLGTQIMHPSVVKNHKHPSELLRGYEIALHPFSGIQLAFLLKYSLCCQISVGGLE